MNEENKVIGRDDSMLRHIVDITRQKTCYWTYGNTSDDIWVIAAIGLDKNQKEILEISTKYQSITMSTKHLPLVSDVINRLRSLDRCPNVDEKA